MENPSQKSMAKENRVPEDGGNIDQEVDGKYEENAPNMYDMNSVNTKQI